jgi:glycogen phosphorylase
MRDEPAVTGPPKPEGMDELVELALNLHWSWNHSSDELWESLDSELWQTTQNPWVILRNGFQTEDTISAGNPRLLSAHSEVSTP